MAKKIFTISENSASEYRCTVVKIGEVRPVEGADKLGQTLVAGETVVVRKDQVKEGDVLMYAPIETVLHTGFLSANNLYEIGEYGKNSNGEEVGALIIESDRAKEKASVVKKTAVKKQRNLDIVKKGYVEGDEKEKFDRAVAILFGDGTDVSDEAKLKELIVQAEKEIADLKAEEQELTKLKDDLRNQAKTKVGFFNKHGRVKIIRLKGVPSKGYLFSLEELAKWMPEVADVNLEEFVGQDFDTVNDELFIKVYVPYVPPVRTRDKSQKAQKKIERFDRMVEGEFKLHYDTDPLAKNMWKISPEDIVTISIKLHGTSAIFGNVKVKVPVSLPLHKWLWNKFVDATGWFKSSRVTDYVIDYGDVYSSRKIIKNQYINKDVTGGYYGVDVWSEYGERMKPFIPKGMTVYGEICGYLTGSDRMIQKKYDYGCEIGHNFLMPYRITTKDEETGITKEWNVLEVKDWTENLIKEHPEIAEYIHVIDVVYHGTLVALYPEISTTEHWHENVLEALKNEKKFGMEENEPLCKNVIPREGIVLRIDDDPSNEAFKLKSDRFFEHERDAMDAGDVDIEMTEGYGDAADDTENA